MIDGVLQQHNNYQQIILLFESQTSIKQISQQILMTTLYLQSQLPFKFAEDLLDCEIEFQLNPKIPHQTLMKLLELYRLGIEYYESIRSYKYLYFQRKMNHIVKSQTILKNLNQPKPQHKPQILVIQSLNNFKKQQISIHSSPQPQQTLKSSNPNKKVHPFKKHLQQKFLSKNAQQTQQNQKQKLQRQTELKKLIELQHKEKHQQLAQTINNIQSDKVMKNFIAIQDKKMKEIQSRVGKVVQDQEEEFRKKLEERRERVKSNTEKRRITKSFSDNYEKWGDSTHVSTGDLQNEIGNVDNCELKVSLDSKGNRIIPSTKMFSSFVQDTSKSFNFDEYTYEQVSNPNKK